MKEFHNQIITIVILGALIYIVRISGFWLAKYIRFNTTVKHWLEYLPGCVMVSVIAPSIFTKNPINYIACIAVAVIMYRTKNLFFAMLSGSGIVILTHLIEVF